MRRIGVFLDRDDTIIADKVYLADPAGIEILPGVPAGIARLNARGLPVILVTNQSGIARGLFSEERLAEIHARLQDLLAQDGARIDAIYFCPHHPDGIVAAYRGSCDCRKPQPGMLRRAARDFGLDLPRCYLIGDKPLDIATIKGVGGKGILLEDTNRAGTPNPESPGLVPPDRVHPDRIPPDRVPPGQDSLGRDFPEPSAAQQDSRARDDSDRVRPNRVIPDFTAPDFAAAVSWIEEDLEPC